MSSTILHLETATEVCSICLSDGETVLALVESQEGYIHSAKITLMIKSAMDQASINFSDLDAVSLSKGPGSYTSLRVGTSAAKAICYAWDIPLIAVDTLGSLALAAAKKEGLKAPACSIPLIDARRMEVYTAVFDANNTIIEKTHAKIIESDAFHSLLTTDNKLLFCGSGLEKCKIILNHPQMIYSTVICTAQNLVIPALQSFLNKDFADVAYFSPYYFKSPSITVSKKKIL
ncbi:MAG: tRNA threonylcarbamoyladenosine biosynthesis protein TsaB [Polaribacter sp.]|jgi:tRNA threonylcarbamoyladenosine biosynthesis protein TsaB